jgi:hypothetical protein
VQWFRGGDGGEVVFSVISPGLGAFAGVNGVAGESIAAVGSADSAAMLEAAAVAIGPIGAGYLAAYGQAQASILAATLLVGRVHEAIGGATDAASMSFVAADDL